MISIGLISSMHPPVIVTDCDSGDDDFQYLSNTMPVDDTYELDDEFDTQLVNLAGETQMVDLDEDTQVMDFDGETQVVDLAGETQVLDDLDCMKSMDTEFFDELNEEVCPDSEDEETNKADIFCETQELSQDDMVKNDGSVLFGLRSTTDKDPSREGKSLQICDIIKVIFFYNELSFYHPYAMVLDS